MAGESNGMCVGMALDTMINLTLKRNNESGELVQNLGEGIKGMKGYITQTLGTHLHRLEPTWLRNG